MISMWLYNFHYFSILLDSSLDSILFFVEFSKETISEFYHDVGEAEE